MKCNVFSGRAILTRCWLNENPGRYRYIQNKWQFEEGDFARNECYDLRLEFVLYEFSGNRIRYSVIGN